MPPRLAQESKIAILPLSLRQERLALTKPVDVMQGTLDMLILKALALEPIHGWGISDRIQRMSGDVFRIGQGSLYPALHRFDNRGWVTSYWRTTENNRIARYYQLTPAGRHALAEEITRWRSYTGAVALLIDAEQPQSTS
jgi:PadR family transcriptional regulator